MEVDFFFRQPAENNDDLSTSWGRFDIVAAPRERERDAEIAPPRPDPAVRPTRASIDDPRRPAARPPSVVGDVVGACTHRYLGLVYRAALA